MIRKAIKKDIDDIIKIVNDIIEEMNNYNNNQWDKSYPLKEDFIKDIENKELYVIDEGKILGFLCANNNEPEEYTNIKWENNEHSLIIHRLGVNINYRNQRIASKLFEYIKTYAKSQGYISIKSDTYSLNKKMNNFFKKNNFAFKGEINMNNKIYPFYCYELIL